MIDLSWLLGPMHILFVSTHLGLDLLVKRYIVYDVDINLERDVASGEACCVLPMELNSGPHRPY